MNKNNTMYTQEQLAEQVKDLQKEVNELKGIIKKDAAAMKRIEKLLLELQDDLSNIDNRTRPKIYGTTNRNRFGN